VNLRDLTTADIPAIVELNNAAYPAVPIMTAEEIAELLASADYAWAAVEADDDGDGILGIIIGMHTGNPYDGESYRWLEERAERDGTDFLYVDRIIVADGTRGKGIGRGLYDAVFELARSEGRAEVTCEVNIEPANPESLAFHARLGFERVGELDTKDGSVRVALLAAAL
jgi:predicted GNAT superfamily acetyltransferase